MDFKSEGTQAPFCLFSRAYVTKSHGLVRVPYELKPVSLFEWAGKLVVRAEKKVCLTGASELSSLPNRLSDAPCLLLLKKYFLETTYKVPQEIS